MKTINLVFLIFSIIFCSCLETENNPDTVPFVFSIYEIDSTSENNYLYGTDAEHIVQDDNGAFYFYGRHYTNYIFYKYENGTWINMEDIIDSITFNNNSVYCLYKDPNNCMWFSTRDRLIKYDGKKYEMVCQDELLLSLKARNMAMDSKGNLWLVSGHSPNLLMFDGEKISKPDIPTLGWTWDIAIDKEDNVWLANYVNIIKYNGSTCTIYDETNSFENYIGSVKTIFADKDNCIWATSLITLYKFNGSKWIEFPENFTEGSRITDIIQSENGHLWFALFESKDYYVAEYDGKHITKYPANIPQLKGKSAAYRLFEDIDNNIWVCSLY